MPFLAYYGCSKLLKARALFYWGTHTRFAVSVGLDPSLTKRRRARSADCISMDKRPRISPLWEIVYYSDTCIVYLAVRETEYFTEILRNIPRMREQWCPGRFFSLPRKKRPGNEARAEYAPKITLSEHSHCARYYNVTRCNGLTLYGRLVRLVRNNSVWRSALDAGVIRSRSPVRFPPARLFFSFFQHFFSAH